MIVILSDVTERKMMETPLIQAQKMEAIAALLDLNALLKDLEKMLRRLIAKTSNSSSICRVTETMRLSIMEIYREV